MRSLALRRARLPKQLRRNFVLISRVRSAPYLRPQSRYEQEHRKSHLHTTSSHFRDTRVYTFLSPSDFTRLVELLPGHGGDPIRLSIIHVKVNEKPEYEALSYCWGKDEDDDYRVISDNAPLDVRRNVYEALHRLRLKDRKRKLWIDALSINQDDIAERSSQVRAMRDIFQQAQRTAVWLGEHSQDSRQAMQFVKDLNNTWKTCPDRKSVDNAWHAAFGRTQPADHPSWPSLFNLLGRSWFYRAWIVQEAAVSSRIVFLCGDDSVGWEELVIATMFARKLRITYDTFPNLWFTQFVRIGEARLRFQNGTPRKLLSLLLQNRQFSASDQRDKVFSFWALADPKDTVKLDLQPDYTLSTEAVYKAFAITALKTRTDLDILSVPRVLEGSQVSNLPSWVPDWSTADSCVPLRSWELFETGIVPTASHFRATGNSQSSPTFSTRANRLGLRGYIIDTIIAAGATNTNPNSESTFLGRPRPWEQSLQKLAIMKQWEGVAAVHTRSNGKYVTGEDMLDAYWQTMCAWYMPSGYSRTRHDFYALRRFFRILLPFTFLARIVPQSWLPYLYDMGVKRIIRMVEIFSGIDLRKHPEDPFPLCGSRRMVRTKDGRIGLAPKYAMPGDKIALFEGGKVPVVVKDKSRFDDETKQDEYEVVGECYVHGIMKGECWSEERCRMMWLV